MIHHYPPILGLFQKRIDGDNALLKLASLKFQEYGLETELYGGDTIEFEETLNFRPEPFKYSIAHLSRDINLLSENGINRVLEFSSKYGHLVSGAVLHDQKIVCERLDDYLYNIKKMCSLLDGSLPVFIEYAAGMETNAYLELLYLLKDTPCVSACIDIGHFGMNQIERKYSEEHRGQNIFRYKRAGVKELKEVIHDVSEAVEEALPSLICLIKQLKSLDKHIHFHLHDGHPLSVLSPYGLSDHLSFFEKIPIPFAHKGENFLEPMFRPSGLADIISASQDYIGIKNLSFTLEIHPSGRRRVIDKEAYLFQHWKDLTNAEIMNHWVWEISRNGCLVKECFNEQKEQYDNL